MHLRVEIEVAQSSVLYNTVWFLYQPIEAIGRGKRIYNQRKDFQVAKAAIYASNKSGCV